MDIPRNLNHIDQQSGSQSIALTFDDGPDPIHTPAVLDVLNDYNIKATFFVLGQAAESYPHIVERMVDAGHTIGNHTYSHRHPWMISSDRARFEVSETTKVITRITGKSPQWFRPPHGRLRRAMLQQARSENMTTVLWSHSIVDWGPLATEEGIFDRMRNASSGDILLMHDGQRQRNRPAITAKYLPNLFSLLMQRSIKPVTLDQFLKS
jgi:peptidoglycan/xylan/chitin deacetylase (PgdA/CDA1 family)